MKAREIMTAHAEVIQPEASIFEAASKMKSLDVGFLPVCDNNRLVGTITDRDIVVRGIADRSDISSLKVSEVMTAGVVYVFEDDETHTVAEKMQEAEVRRVLVLDSSKRLSGIISLGDLSQVKEKLAGQTTKDITEAA